MSGRSSHLVHGLQDRLCVTSIARESAALPRPDKHSRVRPRRGALVRAAGFGPGPPASGKNRRATGKTPTAGSQGHGGRRARPARGAPPERTATRSPPHTPDTAVVEGEVVLGHATLSREGAPVREPSRLGTDDCRLAARAAHSRRRHEQEEQERLPLQSRGAGSSGRDAGGPCPGSHHPGRSRPRADSYPSREDLGLHQRPGGAGQPSGRLATSSRSW